MSSKLIFGPEIRLFDCIVCTGFYQNPVKCHGTAAETIAKPKNSARILDPYNMRYANHPVIPNKIIRQENRHLPPIIWNPARTPDHLVFPLEDVITKHNIFGFTV